MATFPVVADVLVNGAIFPSIYSTPEAVAAAAAPEADGVVTAGVAAAVVPVAIAAEDATATARAASFVAATAIAPVDADLCGVLGWDTKPNDAIGDERYTTRGTQTKGDI